MAKTANISLPDEVMERLDKESKLLGLNRSAYISMALSMKWQSDEVIKVIPELSKLAESIKALSTD